MEPTAPSPTSSAAGAGNRDRPGPRGHAAARLCVLLGFLVLLSSSYYLRTEVLALNRIRFSADEARADYELKRLRESYPERIERHQVELKNHELQLEHYQKLSELYRKDLVKYLEMTKDQAQPQPPQMPARPQPPEPPEIGEKLSQINLAFRTRKAHYFVMTGRLNWVAWAAALALTGGLLYLLLFDREGPRFIYLAVLLLSFVFLIGPSFHSILSAIVGFLEAPRVS
jgi:hypothetical protein